MENNEYDKGARDDLWQTDIDAGCRGVLHEARDNAKSDNVRVSFNPAEFGLLSDAIEIYCTDPADDQDPEYAGQVAIAERFLRYLTVAFEVPA